MNGHFEHDPQCKDPLSEHSGNEDCITWVSDEKPVAIAAHYTQGPQGGQIADHKADYLARYGPSKNSGPLGTVTQDRRDNRDPTEVGLAHLASRNGA